MTVSRSRVTQTEKGAWRLEEDDENRIICQFLFHAPGRLVMLDAGLPESPLGGLVPLIREVAPEVTDIQLVITHVDADHCGGTGLLRREFPTLSVVSHACETPPLGDPERTIRERYECFAQGDGLTLDDAARSRIRGRIGQKFDVDTTFHEPTWTLFEAPQTVAVHLPGHTAGHVGVWRPEGRALYCGDALMGHGIRNRDDSLLYPPQFVDLSRYLDTIELVRRLDPSVIYCAHEQPIRGDRVRAFLGQCEAAALRIQRLTSEGLESGLETLLDLCRSVHSHYDGLPEAREADLATSVRAVLLDAIERGRVQVDRSQVPYRYRAG
jgi:glyoxylase-like metal-dependent hydrolase (beta-lactamase superfamily II)